MKSSSFLALFSIALPIQAGLVSFAVPKTVKSGDDITVIVTMNSAQGSVYDYTLLFSATEKSLPYGYLGGLVFAMIDLRDAPLGTSNWTISTRNAGVGAGKEPVIRGVCLGTVGVMAGVGTHMHEASVERGSETSKDYSVSKILYPVRPGDVQ